MVFEKVFLTDQDLLQQQVTLQKDNVQHRENQKLADHVDWPRMVL